MKVLAFVALAPLCLACTSTSLTSQKSGSFAQKTYSKTLVVADLEALVCPLRFDVRRPGQNRC